MVTVTKALFKTFDFTHVNALFSSSFVVVTHSRQEESFG